MIDLEKLYNSAENHLSKNNRAWAIFAQEFKDIFEAEMILHRIEFGSDGSVTSYQPIATSDPKTVKKYIEDKMYLFRPLAEPDIPPFEPNRRSDLMSDEDFKKLGPYADSMMELGIFHILIVPAILPDGAYGALLVWRDESANDFSDSEKQRLALFMRHLMVLVSQNEFVLSQPESDIVIFGKKFGLTNAEIQILSAMLHGHALKSIAEMTGRTYGTVRWHVQNILTKCQVGTQKNLLREFYLLIKK